LGLEPQLDKDSTTTIEQNDKAKVIFLDILIFARSSLAIDIAPWLQP